ncbi:hypothetical protein AVEN_163817-1 [Araneus ventricosus]|uniref:Uncharacterized protein n=1 Tax=Araneus ventricosus TaxID=182803 RepID=A0A4Y2VVE5_ARAVE|nr:hypothetical protein AVEN_163817-1 [Araneus ventricosus]
MLEENAAFGVLRKFATCPVTEVSAKNEGPMTASCERAGHTLIFGLFHSTSSTAWGFSEPRILQLRLYSLCCSYEMLLHLQPAGVVSPKLSRILLTHVEKTRIIKDIK